MLSKPKYMLPGNLSQGAPILEPDENGDYKFSFALDGDEIIKESSITIYSLQGDKLTDGNIALDLSDLQFELISSNIQDLDGNNLKIGLRMRIYGEKGTQEDEYFPYEKVIDFTPFENASLINHTEITLSFENYFKGIEKNNFLAESTYEEIKKDNSDSKIIPAYEPQAAILPILITKSGGDVSFDGDFMILGPLKYFNNFSGTIPCLIERREDLKWYLKFETTEIDLFYSFSIKEFEGFNEDFKKQDVPYFPFGIYEVNPSVIEFLGTTDVIEEGDHYKKYYDYLTNPTTNMAFKGVKGPRYRFYGDCGGKFYYPSLFNNFADDYVTYSDLSYVVSKDRIWTLKYPAKKRTVYFTIAMSSENKEETFKIDQNYLKEKFLPWLEVSDEYNTPFTASLNTKIKRTIGLMLRINKPFLDSKSENKIVFKGKIKTTALEDTKCYEEIKNLDTYPKDDKGRYKFFSFEVDSNKNLLNEGKEYFWTSKVKNLNDETYESDPQVFKVLKTKKECKIVNNFSNHQFGLQTNESFINNDIVEYWYEIKNKQEEIFYKSPLIKSFNTQFTQLPLYSLPGEVIKEPNELYCDYNIYFYGLTKDMQIIKVEEMIPPAINGEGLKINFTYNPFTKFLSLNWEENEFWQYYDYFTLYREDKITGKYYIVKDKIDKKLGNKEIQDKYNNLKHFRYFVIPIFTSYPFEFFRYGCTFSPWFTNQDIDKWQLILTKEKKSDIIYSVDKVYDFYYNLVSGSIGNNAETAISTNFTSMPSVQKGFSNYWSGSLSALMGVCDERGEFAQTIEQEKALEQLVLDQEHAKFLLDREGNIWQVEISAPLTIANQDGLVQADKLIDLKTITIDWVQVGNPTQIIFDFEE